MAILVLGGAGYIGSHTVWALVDAGHEVAVIDNLETGFRQSLPANVRFYEGDIRSRVFLEHVLQQETIEGIIHFAANSQVGESMLYPLEYYDNNLCGTKTLLMACVDHHIDKIVFSSTAAIYGNPTKTPILEDDCANPTNCYGETKRSMEQMFHWVSQAHGLHFVSMRYFNACGAHTNGQIGEAHAPETHLIPLILQVANGQRDKTSIFGTDYDTRDGTCIRDYIHVLDLAQAHILALEYLLQGGDNNTFNLGNGVGFTVREVIETARSVTGHPILCSEENRRMGDPAILIASSEKAKKMLGWHPAHADLTHIIETAWQWHQTHPHGYSS